jgi:hypothetical protein
VLGWALQFLQPWLLQRRESLLDRAADRALGPKPTPTTEDK